MFPYPLNNFEIQKYYQNETKSRGVYSRNNLPQKKKKKKKKDWGTHSKS